MKKYIAPELEIVEADLEDRIMANASTDPALADEDWFDEGE